MEDLRELDLKAWCEAQTGVRQAQLEAVSGDASFRRYFRASDGRQSLIAVDCPPDKEDMTPFIAVADAYQQAGVQVPSIIAVDQQQGFMLQSDFGHILLLSKLHPRNVRQFYSRALQVLPQVMSVTETQLGPLPDYDEALLERELELFKDWLLKEHIRLDWDTSDDKIWTEFCQQMIENARQQPQVGVHRDYHSRNLMVLANDELGIIDFQDAVSGPITYDAVSLLRDCYIEWSAELVTELAQELRTQLIDNQQLAASVSSEQWQHWFDWMGLQRHTKAAGIFARLAHRDDKPGYLRDVPRTLNYLMKVSANYPELARYHQWLTDKVVPAWERQ
ncbi:aminoglycoside phosphotransferase family protein [Idiomarina seosinensis]|uniref:Serine/threonine protein kinase n=1 Tax=Idiomarina seosinensis TaxID=281739 RepID=A0A432ZB63_9GAMM|nr:phosphotransferase [Idiomarina seosinensis]RUO75196.1 serine/threonine protein kinase [Idiomarina seosinensis]